MTLRMWTAALREARDAWDEQAEALAGPRKNLLQAESSLLGSRVGPAAEAFLSTWEQQVDRLRQDAAGHADALAQTMYDVLVTDAETVERTQQLLMWEDRNTPPVSTVGP